MAVYSIDKIDQSKIYQIIGNGTYAKVYKYKSDLVLKKYVNEVAYEYLIRFHNYEFLKHLERLSTYSSPILVCPKDIFINKHEKVDAYTMDFCNGTYLSEDLSEFNIEKMMKIIKEFYDELMLIDDLLLNDPNPKNLIINEHLNILDLDYTTFLYSKVDLKSQNIRTLNYHIFRSLVKRKYFLEGIEDVKIIEILGKVDEEIRLDEILEEYIEYLNKYFKKVDKVEDLRCSYVKKF